MTTSDLFSGLRGAMPVAGTITAARPRCKRPFRCARCSGGEIGHRVPGRPLVLTVRKESASNGTDPGRGNPCAGGDGA